MTTANLTDADLRMRDTVIRQLDWDPEVDASAVGVAAKGGTVTLTGYIGTYPGKLAAERSAKRVQGVRAVANDIEVRLKAGRTDADIAADVARALELTNAVPDSVQAAVHHGSVALTGKVTGIYQRRAAEKAVRHVCGVRDVRDHMTVASGVVQRDVRHRIVEALHRNANIDARHIIVDVSGDTVALGGTVSTWLQRDAAERAAADAPGISRVENRIAVDPIDQSSDTADIEIC